LRSNFEVFNLHLQSLPRKQRQADVVLTVFLDDGAVLVMCHGGGLLPPKASNQADVVPSAQHLAFQPLRSLRETFY